MRKLSAYEINHLNKFGIDPFTVDVKSIKDKPVEYITGFAEFYGRIFKVDENVLIPRIETERMIDIALEYVKKSNIKSIKFIDIGSGSGAIGITFAKELEKINIKFNGVLSDISNEALEITEQNVKDLQVKVETVKSDLFKNINKQKFNIILANLPYVPSGRINNLDSSVKDFEPKVALDGGADGIELIKELISSIPEYLEKNGIAILEVDDTHNEKVAKDYIYGFDFEILKDLNNKNRFWLLRRT